MKIQFEGNLAYQEEAISSITDIFLGQNQDYQPFSIEKTIGNQMQLGSVENDLGIGNRLLLYPDEILENLHKIQMRNGLPQTKCLKGDDYHFTVEMETGTGKTYVYLRTMLELNKQYGFMKFIIVVPSIAIKEGVYKTLQITEEHFKSIYTNVPYDYFIYDSKKLDQIRNFAVNNSIQIMIITIDAFNKDSNIIHQERDQANGYRPIDYISQCNPIVILDEPQNMETDTARAAILSLNPLCTLRYSATHKLKYNPVYSLNSIDAYEKELVKQIEVATVGLPENNNTEYIRFTQIKASKAGLTAKLELEKKERSGVKRKEISIKRGDYLSELAKRDIYDGYIVNEITYVESDPSKSYVDLGKVKLYLGQVNGGQDPDTIKRLQIRKTIQEHFEKQKRLAKEGIKVLSLFFIDKVANYRIYDPETGEAKKGKYALMFEEEYSHLLELPEYSHMRRQDIPFHEIAASVHDGYFSADKKKSKSGKEYLEEKDTKGNTNADNDTFQKIMRDKEKLLSFEEPLSFIFSHSALKEGWDNPNVFQICTLNETSSEMKKRQEIGRGLRISVNQKGERVRGFHINTLTVMANEAYEEFVSSLQKEMADDENIQFGMIESHIFANIKVKNETKEEYFGYEASERLYEALKEQKYIDDSGFGTRELKEALLEKNLQLPAEFEEFRKAIEIKLKATTGRLVIHNADKKEKILLNKQVFLKEEFQELWERIKYKSTYKVSFSQEELIRKCIEEIDNSVFIPEEKYLYEKKRLQISQGGIDSQTIISEDVKTDIRTKYQLPDIVTYLQNETNLTRKSIVEILTKTKTLESFRKNPQLYLELVAETIQKTMKMFIVHGISYHKIGEQDYYCQELFESQELFGYLRSELNSSGNMIGSTKSPYSNIIVDSEIEKDFVLDLEKNANVITYAKLPAWFKIATPLGNYNPDWAILVKPDLSKELEKLYFVVETKGSIHESDRRETENLKIKCGEKHFEAISPEIHFEVSNSFEHFRRKF